MPGHEGERGSESPVDPFESGREPQLLQAGDVLMAEGERADWFAYVISGAAIVSRGSGPGTVTLGHAGPGSIVGELAMLTGRPRTATVTATAPSVVRIGDLTDFHTMLEQQGWVARIARVVAQRSASLAAPISLTGTDGGLLRLRPGLATDHDAFDAALSEMSSESIRSRFFSASRPPESVIRYLIDVDYIDHFAWVVLDPDADPAVATPVGTARYFRSRENPAEAEIALGMVDRIQGRGIGKRLLDTLAVTASVAGIETLTASVLRDNAAMRALLRRPSTRWTNDEPGVVRATARTDEFGTLLGRQERAAIEDVSASIIWSSVAVLL